MQTLEYQHARPTGLPTPIRAYLPISISFFSLLWAISNAFVPFWLQSKFGINDSDVFVFYVLAGPALATIGLVSGLVMTRGSALRYHKLIGLFISITAIIIFAVQVVYFLSNPPNC